MNKRRRHGAKYRRMAARWQQRWLYAGTFSERRRALLWLRAHEGLVWP